MPDQPEVQPEVQPAEAPKSTATVLFGTKPKLKPTLKLVAPPGGWNVCIHQRTNPHLDKKWK